MDPPITNKYPKRKSIKQINSKLTGIKKICHPGNIKSMILNLQKMNYNTYEEIQEFYKQYRIIYNIFDKEYWSKDEKRLTAELDILIKLINLLNEKVKNACLIKSTLAYFIVYKDKIIFDIYTELLEDELTKCNERYGLLYFDLQLDNTQHGHHANLLIFDKEGKKIYRIEPNYGYEYWHERYDKLIEKSINDFIKNETGIINQYKYIGFFPSSCSKLYHPGFCLWISLAKYIYGLDLSNKLINELIIDFFKSEYNLICSKELK